MQFTIYKSNTVNNRKNCYYSYESVVSDVEGMLAVIKSDHVCAKFKLNYRNVDNFECSNVVVMDCDNDHTEEPSEWIDEHKFESLFHDVNYVLVFSRNHQKQKGDKSPRPRFHVYFTIEPYTNADAYANVKKLIYEKYTFFDPNAIDAARFIFATTQKTIIWHEGTKHITQLLDFSKAEEEFFMGGSKLEIKEGSRNSKMSQYAAKVLKKYGNTVETHNAFLDLASKCTPPLEDSELTTIWNSALKFYNTKVLTNEDYVEPADFNDGEFKYKPKDETDVGQARVFTNCCKDIVRFSPATDYIVYNQCFWEESKIKAQGLVHTLTDKQLAEAQNAAIALRDKLTKGGVMAILESGNKEMLSCLAPDVKEEIRKYGVALAYEKYWYICDSLHAYNSSSYIGSKYISGVYYGCFYDRWYFDGYVYFGSSTTGSIYTTTQNSTVYPYLNGNWYFNTLYSGTATGYRLRIDSDQVTFYYGTKECGDIECYSTYVDIQGTFKTNGNNWISSSDRNLKKEIKPIDDKYGEIFDRLVPVQFKWKEGTSGRIHTGFIAQDVKKATEDAGLTTSDFGAYVHFDASEKDGEIIPESCGVRYEEITPLNTWEIQKLKRRVKELETKMEELLNENH